MAIAWAEATDHKCERFTGHIINCDKSIESLRQFKDEAQKLEKENFPVVYFVADEDLFAQKATNIKEIPSRPMYRPVAAIYFSAYDARTQHSHSRLIAKVAKTDP